LKYADWVVTMKWMFVVVTCLVLLGLPDASPYGGIVLRAESGGKAKRPSVTVSDRIAKADRDHWAFRPLLAAELPRVRGETRNPVDAFLLAKLERHGLAFSRPADRPTLIRRLYLDLLGLPPVPEAVDAFAADPRPDAWERLVDRVLSSPHFGERWGRHWLDAAGYVDVYGTDNDAGIIKVLPGRWRYRDYVVRSLNEDKPFDRFLVEQLAGDEVYDWRAAATFTPEMRDALVATGFLLSAADDTYAPELNTPDVQHRVQQLTGEIVAANLFALTMECAKCHDHKYEAISQRDYYRWLAGFAGAFNPEKWVTAEGRALADVPPAAKARIDEHNRRLDAQIAEAKKQQEAVRARSTGRLRARKLDTVPAQIRDDLVQALAAVPEQRTEVQKYLAVKLGPAVGVTTQETEQGLTVAERMEIANWDPRIAQLQVAKQTYGTIQAVFEQQPPPPVRVLRRGEHNKPGRVVSPGLPAVLEEQISGANGPPPKWSSGRRLRFAQQITDVDSPAGALVVRVQVNRVWQHLFGRGIVESSENFGVTGTPPSHPELLDWLSVRFVTDGRRFKPLIRLLVTSRAYQQASVLDGSTNARHAAQIDPDNRLLCRMRLRRLESEAIRDSLLVVAGRLNRRMGGESLPLKNHGDGNVTLETANLPNPRDRWRRSLYVLSRRTYQLSLLAMFDQPVVSTNCSRRERSAVVTQPLTMLNDDFVREQARALSQRVARIAGGGASERIDTVFRLALGRRPSVSETQVCTQFLSAARPDGLDALCHMLLNTNEFIYTP
jgi:hypothetical protein